MHPASMPSEVVASAARSSKLRDERGSASLEFIAAGLILLVPLVYLILTLSALQAGGMAAEAAARQAARVYVRAETPQSAAAAAERAVEFALADFGADRETATLVVTCTPVPADCLTRRGFVTVVVQIQVPLPLAPSALGGGTALSVPLRAGATQQVSRFWVGP